MEISTSLEWCVTKKEIWVPCFYQSSSGPCRKIGIWGSKCSTWTEINLPCFLVGMLLGCVLVLAFTGNRPFTVKLNTLWLAVGDNPFAPWEKHVCKWVWVGIVGFHSAQILTNAQVKARLAKLFSCYYLLVFSDQPQEAVFSSDHVEHTEDGEWQRSTSTTSSQSERAERHLQNQHKSLASEDTKKKRAQKPSHMRRNIR